MEFNLADLFEAAVDAYPDREYLVANGERRTYAEMEARANRLAHHLAAQGVGPGDHVGIYSYNSVEWVETAWAVFKLRAVWININYRYVEDELRYLFTNADLKAIVVQREFAPQVTTLLPDLDGRAPGGGRGRHGEPPAAGAVGYEDAMAGGGPERDFGPRSADDLYILYTGGTTGMPKGVVWRHEDVFYALGGGVDPVTNTRVRRPEEMAEKGRGGALSLPSHRPAHARCHASGRSWARASCGSKIVLIAKFDPHDVWRLVEHEKVNSLMVTGDAMAKPLVEALDEPGPTYDTLLAGGRGVLGRPLLGSGEGPVLRPPAQHPHHRRHRLVREREQRHDGDRQGQHRHEERADRARPGRDGRARRGPEAGRSPAPG